MSGPPPPTVQPAPQATVRRSAASLLADRHRPHGGACHRLALPGPVQQVQGGVELPAAGVHVAAHGGVVVRAAADREAEGEPPAGQLVQACRGLGQQHRRVDRGEQDVGRQADPAGRAGSGGQGGERVMARVGDTVDGGERREAPFLRAPRPLQQA
jgi:hypothetical protein